MMNTVDQTNREDEPGETADRLLITAHSTLEDDIRNARDTVRDQELARSLRSLLRAETPNPEMQQRIRNQLEQEWLQLQRRRSDRSLSLG